jgi:hypothetical protein
LPTATTGWQFNHWTWSGSVTCSNNSANPTSCSASGSGGSLIAVYGAQITFVTNPVSSALISWGSCSNPGQGNGASFFSTSYGTASVTVCYVPYGYTFSNWSCSGGLACSGSNNPTTVTFTGPGTITLNLQTQTPTNSASTTSSLTSTSSTSTIASLSSMMSTVTSTYSTAEFGFGQMVIISALVAVFLITIRRNVPRKDRPLH